MQAERKLTGYPSVDKPWLKYYAQEEVEEIPHRKIYTHLWECNRNHLHDTALLYYGRKITFLELFAQVDTVARALMGLGVKSGDCVTLLLPTLPETIYLFYALNKIGAIANSIDPRTNGCRLQDYINLTNSKIVFCIDKYIDVCVKAISGTAVVQGVLVSAAQSLALPMKVAYKLANRRVAVPHKFMAWREFLKHGDRISTVNEAPYEAGKLAGIVYTSGTTGIPKGAGLSNDDLVAQSVNMYHALFLPEHGRHLRFLNIMPPWLAYGLTCAMSSILCMGMQMDIIPMFNYKEFDDLILRHKPEIILGVPTYFEELLSSKKLSGANLSFLQAIIVGGSPLNIGTELRINDFLMSHQSHIHITKGYGMTEMCAVATYSVAEACNTEGSVGIPLVYNNVMVIDPETGHELPYHSTGELCLTGPTRMVGYIKNQEETDKIFFEYKSQIWVRTGDLGYICENGEVFVKGRTKQIIIFEGHNVFPSVIEDVLSQHPFVEQVVVIGIKHRDAINTEVPTAYVVLKQGIDYQNAEKELRAYALQKLPQRDIAQEYIFLDTIPLTPNGKVDYHALETLAEQTLS